MPILRVTASPVPLSPSSLNTTTVNAHMLDHISSNPRQILDLNVYSLKAHGPWSGIYKATVDSSTIPSDTSHSVLNAVKLLRILGTGDQQATATSVMNEIKAMLTGISHINIPIISFVDAASSGGLVPGIVTPWYQRGDVLHFLKTDATTDRLALVKQICNGLLYVHENGVVHGNILPTNILITDDARAVITDIGLDICLRNVTFGDTLPVPQGWPYKPSEELFPAVGAQHTKEMDVYALASTIYAMYALAPPLPCGPNQFASVSRGVQMIRDLGHGRILEHSKPAGMSEALWGVLQRCWERHPAQRPSMREVVDMAKRV